MSKLTDDLLASLPEDEPQQVQKDTNQTPECCSQETTALELPPITASEPDFVEWWNALDEKQRQRAFRALHNTGFKGKSTDVALLTDRWTPYGLAPFPGATALGLRLVKFELDLWEKNLLRNIMGPARYTRAVLMDAFDKCMEDLEASDDKGKPVLSAATALSALVRASEAAQPTSDDHVKPPSEGEFDAALGL